MNEFLGKVPHGWWDEFRRRGMTTCNLSYDQWQNRESGRTQLTASEYLALEEIYKQMKKEFIV